MFKQSLLVLVLLTLIQGYSTMGFANVSQPEAQSLTEKMTAQKRAHNETTKMLLAEIHKLKAGVSKNNKTEGVFKQLLGRNNLDSFDHCYPDDDVRCVQRCTSRWSDGSCRGSAPDFCGRNARCAENCQERWTDGACKEYGPDFCGPDANCAINCTSRWSDGSCSEYGPDICY